MDQLKNNFINNYVRHAVVLALKCIFIMYLFYSRHISRFEREHEISNLLTYGHVIIFKFWTYKAEIEYVYSIIHIKNI